MRSMNILATGWLDNVPSVTVAVAAMRYRGRWRRLGVLGVVSRRTIEEGEGTRVTVKTTCKH